MRIPTTLRIAGLAALLALSSNLLLIGFLYLRTRDDGQAAVRERIVEQAGALAAVQTDGALDQAVAGTLASGDRELIAARFDRLGRPRSGNVEAVLPAAAMAAGTALQVAPLKLAGRPAPVESGYVVRGLGADGWLLSGRALGERYALQQTIERSLLLALIFALAFGLACGLLVARDVGRRVAALARGVDAVGDGALDERLPISGSSDAFDLLAQRINRMLDRIGTLMGELRLVTDGLAHDLRSPVGRLRARIERAMATDDAKQRDLLLGGVLAESDTLMRILATMLEIGRSEAGAGREQFAWVDPAALVSELGEMYEPLAEEAGLRLAVTAGGDARRLFGHQQLLAQALSNLVDNAMRHGAEGGEITLFLDSADGEVRLGVADRGRGIPPAERGEARRRFGRLDAARSAAGAGLGLALVEAIAHLHGGRLLLEPNAPGLRAVIVVPRGTARA